MVRGLGRGAQDWDVYGGYAGTNWSGHSCRRVGGKESPGLAKVGAENWHDHMPEAVPRLEKGLRYIIRAVHAAQGVTELQVWLEGSQSSYEQGPELN